MVSSLVGFYCFNLNKTGMKSEMEDLDAVLLLLCLIGPLLVSIFTMLANLIKEENRQGIPWWILNVLVPFTDVFQCLIQASSSTSANW